MPNDSERDFLARTAEFAENRINPAAAEWSIGGSPDSALYSDAADLGLTRVEIARQHGGLGYGFAVKVRVCALLAQADFGFAMSVINTHNVAARLCISAPPSVREAYLDDLLSGRHKACTALTEPGAGSDFAAIRTRARQSKQGWIIDGEKSWIVNGRDAALAIIFAQCKDIGDNSGIGAFLVDLGAAGVQRYDIDSAFSQTSIGTGGFTFESVKVPAENLLLPPADAFKSILNEINGARSYVAAMCNGMLRAALTEVSAYGAQRNTFGKPLAAHQGWRLLLAQAETDLAAAEAMTSRAIHQIDSGQDSQLAAAEAKIHAVQTCQRRLPELLHAMGAEGLRKERCFTRHLAAAQMAALTDGATNILKERVARLTRQSN